GNRYVWFPGSWINVSIGVPPPAPMPPAPPAPPPPAPVYLDNAPPPPPAPIYEAAPPPRAGFVWIPGAHVWRGGRYVWMGGRRGARAAGPPVASGPLGSRRAPPRLA